MKGSGRFLLRPFRGGRFLFLLVSLMLLFFVYPFVHEKVTGFLIFDIIFLVIFLSGIYAISDDRKPFTIALFLCSVAFGARLFGYFVESTSLHAISLSFFLLFFILMELSILTHILKVEKVTTDTVLGAICAYLLIGMIWAMMFLLIEIHQPGSFNIGGTLTEEMGASFIYYSFVTLTTLGYGDIAPLSAPARALSSLEAVTGQVYIAVLIARLVALQIIHSVWRGPGE
jgi:hypothetical protein